jgi:ABC-type phosphate/phosphonate transport system substrate-binding protein
MMHRRSFLHSLLAIPTSCSAAWAFGEPNEKPTFHIGISDTLIRGQMNPAAAPMLLQPMAEVFSLPAKQAAQFQLDRPAGLAKRLQDSNIQLGIMPGIEYGWIHPQYPNLVPLATVFASDIRLGACVLVRADSQVKSLANLKCQTIALPQRLQYHSHLFLHLAIEKLGAEQQGFFARVLTSADVNDGIESVVDQEAVAVLVDTDSWKTYQERKPGRSQKLRVLIQSQPFPTSAVLYQRQSWDEKELQQIEEILCTAHLRAFTRQILNFWRISKFVKYTDEYEQVVKDIVRDIPNPVTPACFVSAQSAK